MPDGLVNEPWLVAELDKFFRNQHIAECVMAETEQIKIRKELGENRRSIDGLGQPKYEFDETILAHWRQRLGHNPLKDSGWLRYMERHHGDKIKVRSIGTKLQVGYGSLSAGGKKRFTKNYGS